MTLASGREIECDIADFCLGGLFLKFASSGKDGAWIEEQKDTTVRIAFTPAAGLDGKPQEFAARLVRQSESGVGVTFDEPPVAALLALNKVAAASRNQKTNIRLYGSEDINELKQLCKTRLKQAVEDSFARFGELIIPRLEGASTTAKSILEQQELLDALWQIHPAIGDVQSRCQNMVLSRLESFGAGKEIDGRDAADLSIVEKDDFEDWLSIAAVNNRLNDRFSRELAILELRLEKVYGFALDMKNNPLAPAMICNGVRQAFADMPLALEVRRIVYAAMQEALEEPLAALYENLLKALPEVERERKLAAPVVRIAPPPAPAEAGMSLGGVASSLMGRVRQHRLSGKPGGASTVSLDMPESSLKALQELIASGRIPAARQAEAVVSANVFGELINAVNMEKSVPAEVMPQFRQMEDSLLQLALLDPGYLNNTGHPAHAALNAIDRLSLVSSNDGKIEDERVLRHISHWAQRVQREAAQNPGVFEEVRAQAEKVLRPLMKERGMRIAQLQAALEGWQKTGQASRAVLRQLDQRVAGKSVPAVVLDLFASGWRNYLIRVVLRKGVGSAEEAEAWGVIDKLLGWLNPQQSAKPAYQEIQHLLQTVDARLRLVSADRDVQDRLLDRLADALLKPGTITCRKVTSVLPAQAQESADAGKNGDDALDAFQVGDWISFSGQPVPLNLIWIGDDPPFYVFCNYKGVRKLELRHDEFLARVNSGEARLAENLELPLMERSFSSMIQNMHQNLLKQAVIDEKTGLLDRREFMRQARARLLHSANSRGDEALPQQVMGVLDLETLRLLRTRIGHEGYHEMVRALAVHLENLLGETSLLSHSAEHTFAFMLPVDTREQMQGLGEKVIAGINRFSFKWADNTYTLSANLGLVRSGSFLDQEEMYAKADEACVESKHQGRNQFVVCREYEAGDETHPGLGYWASMLTDVLQGGRLFLRCQPIVSTGGELSVSHYEVLLGADPDSEEPVNIGEMVAAVEQLRRVSEIDQWVIHSIFDWMRQNPGTLDKIDGLSINLSGQSVSSGSFLEFLTAELDRGDVPGGKLIFEITESAAIDSFAHAERFVRQVRRYGCRFALDDFGVGFSSFSYLKNLKVDYLKIDGSFIRNMSRNEIDVALVSSMHETSRFLGIRTIAEVVENQETLDILRGIGVDYAQGYFTGKPMPIAQLV